MTVTVCGQDFPPRLLGMDLVYQALVEPRRPVHNGGYRREIKDLEEERIGCQGDDDGRNLLVNAHTLTSDPFVHASKTAREEPYQIQPLEAVILD